MICDLSNIGQKKHLQSWKIVRATVSNIPKKNKRRKNHVKI